MIKAALIDMDGILYDSMPSHAKAWEETFRSYQIPCTYEEFYLHEGRPGFSTINLIFQRTYQRDATQQEIDEIYAMKCRLFKEYDKQKVMPGAKKLLSKLKACNLKIVLVTGSGQHSLLDNLEKRFPGYFQKDLIVTAYDVTQGKPHPEPYLIGLKKAGVPASKAIAIENSPIGIASAVAAGICTIAVNTGPLEDKLLLAEKPDIMYASVADMADDWDELKGSLIYQKVYFPF
ncbi:MAG: HAD-IA family hydrolase [Dysgonamonadaceae bacterium]|jgi:HAD superfamily hydrolase (TIGR01509 family)|nr:HAD-IA family hydrolase [Dysgonamonadaceae bacterium]